MPDCMASEKGVIPHYCYFDRTENNRPLTLSQRDGILSLLCFYNYLDALGNVAVEAQLDIEFTQHAQ